MAMILISLLALVSSPTPLFEVSKASEDPVVVAVPADLPSSKVSAILRQKHLSVPTHAPKRWVQFPDYPYRVMMYQNRLDAPLQRLAEEYAFIGPQSGHYPAKGELSFLIRAAKNKSHTDLIIQYYELRPEDLSWAASFALDQQTMMRSYNKYASFAVPGGLSDWLPPAFAKKLKTKSLSVGLANPQVGGCLDKRTGKASGKDHATRLAASSLATRGPVLATLLADGIPESVYWFQASDISAAIVATSSTSEVLVMNGKQPARGGSVGAVCDSQLIGPWPIGSDGRAKLPDPKTLCPQGPDYLEFYYEDPGQEHWVWLHGADESDFSNHPAELSPFYSSKPVEKPKQFFNWSVDLGKAAPAMTVRLSGTAVMLNDSNALIPMSDSLEITVAPGRQTWGMQAQTIVADLDKQGRFQVDYTIPAEVKDGVLVFAPRIWGIATEEVELHILISSLDQPTEASQSMAYLALDQNNRVLLFAEKLGSKPFSCKVSGYRNRERFEKHWSGRLNTQGMAMYQGTIEQSPEFECYIELSANKRLILEPLYLSSRETIAKRKRGHSKVVPLEAKPSEIVAGGPKQPTLGDAPWQQVRVKHRAKSEFYQELVARTGRQIWPWTTSIEVLSAGNLSVPQISSTIKGEIWRIEVRDSQGHPLDLLPNLRAVEENFHSRSGIGFDRSVFSPQETSRVTAPHHFIRYSPANIVRLEAPKNFACPQVVVNTETQIEAAGQLQVIGVANEEPLADIFGSSSLSSVRGPSGLGVGVVRAPFDPNPRPSRYREMVRASTLSPKQAIVRLETYAQPKSAGVYEIDLSQLAKNRRWEMVAWLHHQGALVSHTEWVFLPKH